ncbi:ABC transporter permease subunit [Pseudalkalibacillus berkeleyi]|uniref:ABC transporter permease subunit n=1 Tax=Pseudalkalibacillus berkeleyi TaxID=1069813 RepID=A0ABS9GZU8_9BACL|nr:ABC transporter permease subunit [Pseudalkalibacillus berkeleyi]MCF6137291.1 ABC transporter permease subunit [Pseudalkalibacillus berkeleyi]
MRNFLAITGIKALLTVIGIVLFGCLPFLLFNMEANKEILYLINQKKMSNASYLVDEIMFNWKGYMGQIATTLRELSTFWELTYSTKTGQITPVFPEFRELYLKSASYFLGGLVVAVCVSTLLVHIIMMTSKKMRRAIKAVLTILKSLPDVFYIIIVQIAIIMVFRQTGVVLFNTSHTFGDRAVFFPIMILSILPTVYFVKFLLLAFEDQEESLYVELARGKGIARFRIISIHIFRNAVPSLRNHFKTIFWIMLSNWLMVEIFMNFNGLMMFLLENGPLNPSLFILGVLTIFVPYFLISVLHSLISMSVKNATLRRGMEDAA